MGIGKKTGIGQMERGGLASPKWTGSAYRIGYPEYQKMRENPWVVWA